jgi:hypothetical protein
MQERNRQRRIGPGPGGGLFDQHVPGSATVRHGPFQEELPVAQMTVAQVRDRFRDRLDIDPLALAVLDGHRVDDSAVVRAGQTLTFVRPAGEKGRAVA